MENILVAIDRPEHANQLIDQAVRLAKLTHGKIWIIHVSPADPDDYLAREAGPQYVYDQRAEERKKEAAFIARCAEEIRSEHGLSAEGLLVTGSITETLRKKVEEHNIDLVVAGHQKRNLLYDLFTTNKKKDLIDELKVPLLAVPLSKKHD